MKIEDNRGKKLLDGTGCYVEEKKKRDSISFKRMSLKIVYVVYFYQTTGNIQEN